MNRITQYSASDDLFAVNESDKAMLAFGPVALPSQADFRVALLLSSVEAS